MKFRPNKYQTSIAVYAFLVIAAAILFYEAIKNIQPLMNGVAALFRFVEPVVYGFVFAFLLNPMLRLYDDRFLRFISRDRLRPKTRRTIALLLTYPTMLILLGAFIALVIPQLTESVYRLFGYIPYYMQVLQDLYGKFTTNMKDFQLLSQGTELASMLDGVINSILGTMEGLLENVYLYLKDLLPGLISAGAKFTTGLINLLLGVIISIYFLFDREKLFAQAKKISCAIFKPHTHNLLYDIVMDANRVFSGFIIGKIIDSAIIGILCFIGMSAMKMPFAVLISVIVGVTNVIPYFGPFIGAIPGILIIFIVSPMMAVWFAIFILLLQQFDGNILGPKILGDTTGLSALWVIFAIMLFSGLFGVLGMFIGVPLFAIIHNLVKRVVSYLLRRKEMSDNTRDYASEQNPLIK